MNKHKAVTLDALKTGGCLVPSDGSAACDSSPFCMPGFAFSDKTLRPYINRNRIPIASFTASDPQALADLFKSLFACNGEGEGITISVSVSYNYNLIETSIASPLTASQPVLLLPPSTYAASLPFWFAEQLNSWLTTNCPPRKEGEWQFSVSLYSTVQPNQAMLNSQWTNIVSPLPATEIHNEVHC